MSSLSCEVIADLLPCYVDGICSEESRALVDEHLVGCGVCRERAERMQAAEIVCDQTDAGEIDHMKKVKRHMANKSLLSFAILSGFIVVGMAAVIRNYGYAPIELYYVLLPVLLGSAYLTLSSMATESRPGGFTLGMSALGLVMTSYTVLLEIMVVQWVVSGRFPFGLQLVQVGPFVYRQLLAITIAHAAIFIIVIWVGIKSGQSRLLPLGISVTGSCIALTFISLMKTLSSMEGFSAHRNQTLFILLAEGVLITVILYVLERKPASAKSGMTK